MIQHHESKSLKGVLTQLESPASIQISGLSNPAEQHMMPSGFPSLVYRKAAELGQGVSVGCEKNR